MAQSHFYCMDYWVLDNAEYKKSVQLTFPAGLEVDVSDHAAVPGSPTEFQPVIWYTTFRSTDEYATFLASVCPEMPPSQSPIFAFATRTFGGSNQFSNFNLPIGPQNLAALHTYLLAHFPDIDAAQTVQDLLPAARRIDVMNIIAEIIQPGRAPIVWGA